MNPDSRTTPRRLLPPLAAALLLLLAGCTGNRPEGPPQLLERLLAAPRESLGTTVASARAALPAPVVEALVLVPNRHLPGVDDRRHVLDAGAVNVAVYEATASGRQFLERVTLHAPQEAIELPLQVGAGRAEVLERLGPPHRKEGKIWTYAGAGAAPDLLELRLEGDRVTAMTWRYYLD